MGQTQGSKRFRNSVRGGWGMRVLTTAMLVGGSGVAFAYEHPTDFDIPGSPDKVAQRQAAKGKDKEKSGSESTTTSPKVPVEIVAFTKAKPGDCLTWDVNQETQSINNFRIVDCAEPHNYEVASRLDLRNTEAWRGQFGLKADYPTEDSLVQLRDGVCEKEVTKYMDGKFDKRGRFLSAPIIPPQAKWDEGDRTLLCGVQPSAPEGQDAKIAGPAAETDQSRTFEVGTCATTDANGGLVPTDCASNHFMESVGIVDLQTVFPGVTPTAQEQNDALAQQCTQMAMDYVGGDEALYQSTLVPFWITIPEDSYAAGSHSTNCWLVKDNGSGGFSTLAGKANESFTIDGYAPIAPPPRNPINPNAAGTPGG